MPTNSNQKELSRELTGTINSHAQFDALGIEIIPTPQLPNQRCVRCSFVECKGKPPEETEAGCPNYRRR